MLMAVLVVLVGADEDESKASKECKNSYFSSWCQTCCALKCHQCVGYFNDDDCYCSKSISSDYDSSWNAWG